MRFFVFGQTDVNNEVVSFDEVYPYGIPNKSLPEAEESPQYYTFFVCLSRRMIGAMETD